MYCWLIFNLRQSNKKYETHFHLSDKSSNRDARSPPALFPPLYRRESSVSEMDVDLPLEYVGDPKPGFLSRLCLLFVEDSVLEREKYLHRTTIVTPKRIIGNLIHSNFRKVKHKVRNNQ